MMGDNDVEVVASSDNFSVWQMEDEDGEVTYHIELNNVTVHFFEEEWLEFIDLVKALQ